MGAFNMSERGSRAFYQEQAARLSALAADVEDPALRLHVHDLAKSLEMLADFTAVKQDRAPNTDVA